MALELLGFTTNMCVRSISFVVAVLVMSTGSGLAQAWTKDFQDSSPSRPAQTQSPPAQVQNQHARTKSPQARTQDPPAQVRNPQTQGSRWQKWPKNLYAEIDLGGVYQQENTTLFQSAPFPSSATASFNLGVRGNIALGYNINQSWAVEFDTGVLWNSMAKVNGVSLDQPYPLNVTFDTYTIPLLANVIYRFPLKSPLVPYVEAGVGGAASILSYSQASATMEDTSFGFAYQAEVGLKYKLGKRAFIGVAYQFLSTTDPNWSSMLSVGGLPSLEYAFKEKGFYTHSLVLSLVWNF